MDEPLGANSSETSLHSTTPAAAAVGGTVKGKGSHISALRSLGLLHELQEYVAACVETQQQQEKELGKLKAEKKEVERVLKQKVLRGAQKQPCVQQLQASEISDLPPRLRALFEDNKVLKEQTRRYKHRVQEAERHAATAEQQLLAAQVANSKLKGQVLEGHAGQDSEVVQLRQQAESLARALEKLQHAHQVLQQKLETDARLHRQMLAAAARDRQQVEQQVQELQQQLDSKDKEARAHALAAKQAQRKMEEAKATATKAVAGVNARVAEAVATAEALHKQAEDARVHLMLCIIREPGSSRQHQSRQQQQQQQELQEQQDPLGAGGSVWADEAAHHTSSHAGVSSSYTGDLSRDQAVLRLQAGARGYLARKQLRMQRQQQEDALVLVQAGQQQQQQQQVLQEQQDLLQDPAAAGAPAGFSHSSGTQPGAGQQTALSSLALMDGSNDLPMQLPAFSTTPPAGSSPPHSAGSAGAVGAAVPGVSTAGQGPQAEVGGPMRSSRQRVGAGTASGVMSGSSKPPVPVPIKPPPASAPHTRTAARQDSRGQHKSTRSGPGSTMAAAAPAFGSSAACGRSAVVRGAAAGSTSGRGLVNQEGSSTHGRAAGSSAGAESAANNKQQQQQQQQPERQRRLSLQPTSR